MTNPPSKEFVSWFDEAFTALFWRAQHPLTLSAVAQAAKIRRVQVEPPFYPILILLAERREVRITEVADALGVTVATASRHVATLVQRNHVERDQDPKDSRAVIVRLSPEGADALNRTRESWQTILGEMISPWSQDERHRMGQAMMRLAAGFADMHSEMSRQRERKRRSARAR